MEQEKGRKPSYLFFVAFERAKTLSIDFILLSITLYVYLSKSKFNLIIEDGELIPLILTSIYMLIILFGVLTLYLFFYSLFELLLIDNGILLNLYSNKYLYKVDSIAKPICDDGILYYIKEKYHFKLIILANTIGLFFLKDLNNDSDIYNYVKVFLISYIILKILFFNKRFLSSTRIFLKYRELFPYKEKELEEELFFTIRNRNKILSIILIPITIYTIPKIWFYFILYLICSFMLNKNSFRRYYENKKLEVKIEDKDIRINFGNKTNKYDYFDR